MKTLLMTAAGGPEVLQLRDIPEPRITAADQVKVKLRGAGINPIDTKLRSRGVLFPEALPCVLGCDGAGEVVECGAAVTGLEPGDPVWFCHGGLGREPGNYAQYTVVPASVARPMPNTLDALHAAAGPLVLITAWEALFDRAQLQAGQTVLIHAGAGGVGHVAIQLAKHAGARVCTTASGVDKAAFVRGLGADQVIDHRQTDFAAAVNAWTDGRGVDVVLDCVGGETFRRSLDATAHYGSVVTLLEPGTDVSWKEARTRNLRIGFELMLTPMVRDLPQARAHQGEILDRCAGMIDAGQLQLHVSEVLPLAQATEAHARVEQGRVQGKLVLDPWA
ncbi:MAG: zinc-dependent alcohol dehydrogenase family protein [Gammaproteobacteria bacterium]|nr:zinc-dependent alcohol dehydrogenase family protein [Gammaproteobacteria bacterium]